MERSMWLGAAGLALWLAMAAACNGGGGGADVCPMKSDNCANWRTKYCPVGPMSKALAAKVEELKNCVCAAQEAGESYSSCTEAFSAGDQEANSYQQCIHDRCGGEDVCNY